VRVTDPSCPSLLYLFESIARSLSPPVNLFSTMSPAHSCLPHVQHLSTRVVGPRVLGKSPTDQDASDPAILLPKTGMEKVSDSSICTSLYIQVRSQFSFPVSSPSSSSAHSRSTTRRAAWGMTWSGNHGIHGVNLQKSIESSIRHFTIQAPPNFTSQPPTTITSIKNLTMANHVITSQIKNLPYQK
jgi:hypothetical protein